MLTNVTEDGTAHWNCHGCGKEHQAHVSHERMEWTPQEHIMALKQRGFSEEQARQLLKTDMLALPPCECGDRWFLKVNFTAAELAAPNMIDENGHSTESHRAAHRHIALASHMKRIGKHP